MARPTRFGSFDKDAYDRWRASIPFTDEQIAAAIVDEVAQKWPDDAERMRVAREVARTVLTGHMTGRVYRNILPVLVRTCEFCPHKALYRYGSAGRCSQHRHIVSSGQRLYEQLREARSAGIDGRKDGYDRRLRAADLRRAYRNSGKQKA